MSGGAGCAVLNAGSSDRSSVRSMTSADTPPPPLPPPGRDWLPDGWLPVAWLLSRPTAAEGLPNSRKSGFSAPWLAEEAGCVDDCAGYAGSSRLLHSNLPRAWNSVRPWSRPVKAVLRGGGSGCPPRLSRLRFAAAPCAERGWCPSLNGRPAACVLLRRRWQHVPSGL